MIDPMCQASAQQVWAVAGICSLAGLLCGTIARASLARVGRGRAVEFQSVSAFPLSCLLPLAMAAGGLLLAEIGTPSVDECASTDVIVYPLVAGGVTGLATLPGFAMTGRLFDRS